MSLDHSSLDDLYVRLPSRVALRRSTAEADPLRRLFREAVFNLKLPSGRRLDAVLRASGIVARELGRAGVAGELRFKHLYHDREEVTGHLRLAEAGPTPSGGRAGSPKPRRPAPGRAGAPKCGRGRRRGG